MRDSKDKKGRNHGRSIDGIIGVRPRLGLSGASFQPNRARPSAGLGSSLRRAEGFHPMRTGSGSLGAAAATAEADMLLDEPIVLDEDALSGEKAGGHRRFSLGGRLT